MKDIAESIHEMGNLDRLVLFAFPISGSVEQTGSGGYQKEAIQLHGQLGQIWIWEHLYKDSVVPESGGNPSYTAKHGLQVII